MSNFLSHHGLSDANVIVFRPALTGLVSVMVCTWLSVYASFLNVKMLERKRANAQPHYPETCKNFTLYFTCSEISFDRFSHSAIFKIGRRKFLMTMIPYYSVYFLELYIAIQYSMYMFHNFIVFRYILFNYNLTMIAVETSS